MERFLEIVVLVALLAAFMVMLVKKWGWAEWMQVHGDRYTSQLFSCDLCMSFWAAAVITLMILCWSDNTVYVFIPVFTTPITRFLV